VAARRGKNQARRNGAGKRSGLTWLVVGLALGGLVFGYLHFKGSVPLASLLPTPNPNATARPASSDDGLADAPERPKPKYDFYKLLPEKEVVIPDAELDAQARAETAAAQARALADEKAAAAARQAPGEALGLDGDAPATAVAPADAARPSAPAAPGAAAAPITSDGAQYLIQAGAFLGSNEAEALKAKIALTGEVARVEIAQINGISVHRVRMGPYPNAASLAAAKAALAAHGIAAQAIRVK
jgi:cell division protein FtsN